MRWPYLLALLSLVAAPPVHSLTDGEDLYQVCQTNRGLYRSGVCQGLMTGFDAGYQLGLIYGLVGKSLYCKPEDATPMEMQMSVASYLEAHPERRGEEYGVIILEALRSAWPCVGEH